MGASSEVTKSEHPYALYIITEFYQGGDLLSLLLDTSVNLGWKFRVNIANQAAKAVAYLHDNNMLHRDIKACNFLLDHNWVLKLADFGLSRVVADPLMPSQYVYYYI